MLYRPEQALPPIPVLDVDEPFPLATLAAEEARAHALMDRATRHVPPVVLSALDRISRHWLVRNGNDHLGEIDLVAVRLGRPGAYFLALNYEWGCTVGVKRCPEGRTARLVRVLDWRTPGLGRHIIAARVKGPAGLFVTLTWPGYTGVLQGMAPGRFSAALNQAPMRRLGGGFYPLDWAVSRARVWHMPHAMAAHVLRDAFERAPCFADARRMLIETPIAAPAIYALAGLGAGETCIIERTETAAHVIDGESAAANHWQGVRWSGRPRGRRSRERSQTMYDVVPAVLDPAWPWLRPPILNDRTRLVMVADASTGRIVAQGFEADGAATAPLDIAV